MLDIFNLPLDWVQLIYLSVAAISTLLGILLFILSLFGGGDADIDVDGSWEANLGDGGTPWLSVRGIIGFLMGIGWVGLATSQFGPFWSLLCGLAAGGAMFVIIALLMRFIYSLRSSGNFSPDTSLPGMSAVAYITILPSGQPGGQIQVQTPSGLRFYPAITTRETPIPANSPVTILAFANGIATVTSP